MTFLYLFALLCLGVYSYSQIDLNLTLFHAEVFLQFQKLLIQLGYFHRGLSTMVFGFLLLLLFWSCRRLDHNNWNKIIIIAMVVGLLSYPGFSHDFFNYLFDARIVTHYKQNPYLLKALDFPNDLWTRFMHWTHRTYPYGPIWLVISLIPSFLGFGKFILTALNFKLMFIVAYGVCCYVISRLNYKNLWIFAFNPLVIIEGLISPHIDLVMLMFALLAVYKFKWVNLLLSIGIKFSTLTLIPAFLFISSKRFYDWLISTAYLSVLLQIVFREVLPHYFLLPLGLTALSDDKKWHYLAMTVSFVALFARYIPFLYTGEWVTYKLWLF